MYSKFASDDHGTKFSCVDGEVGVHLVAWSVVFIILILVQNDRKKNNFSALATPELR